MWCLGLKHPSSGRVILSEAGPQCGTAESKDPYSQKETGRSGGCI